MRALASLVLSLAVAACSKTSAPPAVPAPQPAPPAAVPGLPLRVDPDLGRENRRPAVPALSLIIDDLGEQHEAGMRALRLPGAVAYAFLPGTPYVADEAEAVHRSGREVLLHLPMEHPHGKLYPLGLAQSTPHEELVRRFRAALATVPHAAGVNNHQGSLLTERHEPMVWLMNEIRAAGNLYFVDSRTSARSVAYEVARQMGVAAAQREVFLDAERTPAAIARAWQTGLDLARRHGTVLLIGHPYAETLALLETELPRLPDSGVQLIAPSELIRRRSGTHPRTLPPLRLTPTLSPASLTTAPAPPAPPPAAAPAATAAPP